MFYLVKIVTGSWESVNTYNCFIYSSKFTCLVCKEKKILSNTELLK